MLTIEQEMKGKAAVITGGSIGIGKGCAKAFCEAGMNVVICARNESRGYSAADELTALKGGTCVFKKCDISDPAQVKELVDFAVNRFGRLDTMVNNAAYLPPWDDTIDMSVESYARVLGTNLSGTFFGCKYALPYLRQTKGSIINMSSVLAVTAQEKTAGYTTTKGGICALTRVVAIEEARHGVRVNCMMPGHVITELFLEEKQRMQDPEKYEQDCNHLSWLMRGGTTDEIGHTALFLASSWAGFITGESIMVSGGMELGAIAKSYNYDNVL